MPWELPNSFTDASENWSNEANIYDNQESTHASITVPASSWSDFLELLPYNNSACSKIRFNALYSGATINSIDIDAYYSDQWNDIYSGSFTDAAFIEKPILESPTVEKFRVRFYNTSAGAVEAKLYEFHFYQITAADVLLADTIAYFKLNDDVANSDVLNEIGSKGTLTSGNSEDISATGLASNLNKCFDFPGDRCINLGSGSEFKPAGLPISFSFWVKFDTVATAQHLINLGSPTTQYGFCNVQLLAGGQLRTTYSCVGTAGPSNRRSRDTTDALSAGVVYHVVCLLGGYTDIEIYTNAMINIGAYSGDYYGDVEYNSDNSIIGAKNTTPDDPLNGFMDDVRIYHKKLTVEEINFLYNSGVGTELLAPVPKEYRFVLRNRNKYNLVSQNTEQYKILLDGNGNEIEKSPTAPSNIIIEPAAAGKALVTAQYFYDTEDSYAADQWLIYYTTDGTDPNPETDAPFVVDMKKLNGIADLSWTSPFGGDSLTLKALVRTRRSGTPYNYDSTNTSAVSCTGSTSGPAAIAGHTTQGQAIELVK